MENFNGSGLLNIVLAIGFLNLAISFVCLIVVNFSKFSSELYQIEKRGDDSKTLLHDCIFENDTISKHLKNIYLEGELLEAANISKMETVVNRGFRGEVKVFFNPLIYSYSCLFLLIYFYKILNFDQNNLASFFILNLTIGFLNYLFLKLILDFKNFVTQNARRK